MRLHDLKPARGARKQRTRVGRGIAAGKGKTAGRGHKGQGARSGGGKGLYFEGGQLPLVRRLPFKRGFTNIFRIRYQEVNIGQLAERFAAGAVITPAALAEAGLVRKADDPVVVLGQGEIDFALTVQAHRFSSSAKSQLIAAGGAAKKLPLLLRGARATVKKLRRAERARAMEAEAARLANQASEADEGATDA